MIFYENRLLADDSHEISHLCRKLGKMMQNLSSAAVVIVALNHDEMLLSTISCFQIWSSLFANALFRELVLGTNS